MIRIPSTTLRVGSTEEERAELGRQYDFHPSWLADELPAEEVTLKEFWIDRFPVTNRQYAAYLRATGRGGPARWDPAMLDHPVVSISGQQAAGYAAWAGKRLPTAQEWECAFQGVAAEPGPLKLSWEWQTQTRPVSEGAVSPSGAGGYGLVSEHTTTDHLAAGEFVLKGPSWLHEEAWSFRPQAAYDLGGNAFAYTGFRCAADSYVPDRPELCEPLPEEWLVPAAEEPTSPPAADHVSLSKFGERYFTVQFGRPEGVCHLFCPELVSVDGKSDVFVYSTSPTVTWQEGEHEEVLRRAAYTVEGDFIRTEYALETGPDWVDVQYVIPNEGDTAERVHISTCVTAFSTFNLYDIEGARTYIWFGEGDWIRMRQVPRGPHGRTLTYHAPPSIPESPRAVVTAVVSRDGASVFGYAKAGLGREYMVHDNAMICCFHIDPVVEVPPGDTHTVRGRVYHIEGDLEALRQRVAADFSL